MDSSRPISVAVYYSWYENTIWLFYYNSNPPLLSFYAKELFEGFSCSEKNPNFPIRYWLSLTIRIDMEKFV